MQRSEIRGKFARVGFPGGAQAGFPGFHFIPSGLRSLKSDRLLASLPPPRRGLVFHRKHRRFDP